MEAIDEANKLEPLQSSRASSQQTNFAWNFLPPLSHHSDAIPNSISNLSIHEINGHSQKPLLGKNFMNVNSPKSYEGLPPRKNQQRSSNDSIPLGFSAMMLSSPQLIPISGQTFSGSLGVIKKEEKSEEKSGEIGKIINTDNLDVLHSSAVEDKDSECSDNEVESRVNGEKRNEVSNGVKLDSLVENTELGVKRSYAGGEIVPNTRHFRSISMDSFMGDLDLDDEPRKFSALGSRIGSMDANLLKFSLEFGNGEFTPTELKKIMANDKLAEIALSDPKRAKRILANRQSAARSKERKTRYISELEFKVQNLQTEANTLSTQLAVTQRETSGLSTQNNELKFRLQAMEQQAQLKDALNEALTAEVQRLKVATAEIRPSMAWLGTVG